MSTSPNQPAGTAGRARVLIVVPTLGTRTDYLAETLESISGQSEAADIVVVTPTGADTARGLAREFGAQIVDDPGGLSPAINVGMALAGPTHEYVNWLGDDDTLTRGSLAAVAAALDGTPRASAAFGSCLYVDEHNTPLWLSHAGKAAPWLLSWGPDLVPQPGMLIRREAWQAVGGLDPALRFAMDLDLLLRLKRWGPLLAVPRVVSTFRWHTESLTVSQRSDSTAEAEAVKRRYLPGALRPLAPVWERPVRWATLRAARRVTAAGE